MDNLEDSLSQSMDKVIDGLKKQLMRVKTGRASTDALDDISIDYYGVPTPVKQVGQISCPEARLLQIRPFDKNMISSIEKAVLAANMGLTPSNDGNLIRIPFPTLTEQKRTQRVKEIGKIGENAKISIRNCRREQNDLVKKEEKEKNISEDEMKRLQKRVQVVTDNYIKKIDDLIDAKEKELLQI